MPGGGARGHNLEHLQKVGFLCYAPVICIPGSIGAGDSGDIAGHKCRDLTFDESRQCRGCAGVLISRQNANLCHILHQGGSSGCTFAQSDQLLFRCLDD